MAETEKGKLKYYVPDAWAGRGCIAAKAVDVARVELAEFGVNKPANLGLRHRFIQATCRGGIKSTPLCIAGRMLLHVPNRLAKF
jgi:hypothetical protein